MLFYLHVGVHVCSQLPSRLPTFLEPSFRVQSSWAFIEHLLCAKHEALKVNGIICDFKELHTASSTRFFPSVAIRKAAPPPVLLQHFISGG